MPVLSYNIQCLSIATTLLDTPISLRVGTEIKVHSYLIKFGNNSNYIDNTGAGGVVCSIDRNGKISDFAYDSNFKKISNHPFTGASFRNIKLPNFEILENTIVNAHKKLPYFDLAAWDFGLDENNEYVLIEYNLGAQGINYHQVFNGPIFNEYLEPILEQIIFSN